jgi:MYXO-CTERM domain-containing protein
MDKVEEGGQPEEENEGLPIFLPLLGLAALFARRQRLKL